MLITEDWFMKNRRRLFMAGYVILVFLGLFIFFIRIHPLIIYDTDDWLYVAYARNKQSQKNK